ncbi:MAG: choice-of-anchor tandem repeat GloVer-containing protein [Verrucomicrobiota bacterium]
MLLLCHLAGAVTFSVTPAAVGNTYNGVITLQVGGLTNNETVVVQKFLDLNTNGVIDAGDWLVQQFNLTDGQPGMVIGGIVNSNVPGDTDTTPGQITAQLNFRNGDMVQNFVGQYAFKLSSPGGHFEPITNFFSVTNFPYAQKFTGNVVSNGTGTTVPNALVLLLGSGNKKALAGAVADNSGGYTIAAPPGTYMPVALKSGYVANFSTPPVLTLSSGQTNTTNLTLLSATASISGQLADANNSSIGLPGILLSARATNGLMGVSFTDGNGNFSVSVQTNLGQWEVAPNESGLIVHGYLELQNKGTSATAGQTNVTLALPRATALFYGSVKDNLGNPMPGLEIYADDNNNVYEGDGYTDANGNYAAVALGGLNNDPWRTQISSDTSPTNYFFSQPDFDWNDGTNISAGEAVLANFTAVLATNTISGSLKDGSGHPLGGIGVEASATINGVYYQLEAVDTDTNGKYSLNVANSTWTVAVLQYGSSDSLPANYFCLSQTVVISNNNATVNLTALFGTNTISGSLKDDSGNPIAGVWVWDNAWINGVTYYQGGKETDANGNYSLNVVNSTWTVGVNSCSDCGDGLPVKYLCPPTQTVVISNNNGTANFTALLATNDITGVVKDSNGNPIGGVGVWANATINGAGYFQYVDADTNGNYSLNVANGSWTVGVECNGGSDSLDNILGSGNYQCPNNQSVGITNNNGVANFAVPLCSGLTITTTSLPAGEVNVYYDQFLQASSCSSTLTWSLLAGSLPPGLTGDPFSGEIYGTATSAGAYDFIVQVIDGNGLRANQALSLTINGGELQVTTTSLSSGTTNVAYTSRQLTARGGQPPYRWSLASGMLPPGMSLSTNGVISGTPTVAGNSNFVVQVTDSVSATATKALSLVIYPFSTSVSFNVTPPAVSNFYTGIITLQVGGLVTGETVLVKKYRDNNGNGLIDAGDSEVQQFQLTDGQASVFYDGTTAVTNFNVAGDLTPADGAITAQLPLALSGSSQMTVAQYAFRLSSPTGRFAPITNLFNVTNSAFAQSFTGNVVCSGTNVPHALACLFIPPFSANITLIASSLADGDGGYRLSAPPGTYLLCAFKSGFVADAGNAPVLALGANATIPTNLSLLPATCSLSGRFVDAANTNAGLPCVHVKGGSANGLVTSGTADGNGNFALPATTDWWGVLGDSQSLDSQGYLGLQSAAIVNANAGSVAGVTIALARGTALVYGAVQDGQNHPLSGVRLSGSQNDGASPYVGDATSDQNGNYAMAVNDAGVWNAGISGNNPAFPNYLWSAGLGDTTFANGQAVQCNFTALVATNYITGSVLDSSNNPITNIQVYGSATIGNQDYNAASAFTDANGNYSLTVASGAWQITLDCDALGWLGYCCPNYPPVIVSGGNAVENFALVLNSEVQVTTTNLPPGYVGSPYDVFLQAAGCQPPFAWSVVSGSLPSGLQLASTGELSGTPNNADAFNFTAQVSDANNNTANQALSLIVNTNTPLEITTVSLLTATQAVFYTATLGASGGQKPYSWSLAPGSGPLPATLSLATNGVLSGTPATNGTFYFYVRATDAIKTTADQLLTLTVNGLTNNPYDSNVTFSVTPSAVSNSYMGAITLEIGGLANGETVVVQKYLDANSNGLVDAGDWLVQQFSLSDGLASMIDGVTNSNIPGDTDTTPGQITAKLNFRNGDFMQNIVGQYAFKLSSPTGRFAPITNLFSVTNFPYAQKFTGNVVSNGTSTTVSNALVLLFPPPRAGKSGPSGSPLAGAVADNSGSYSIQAPPGTYSLCAFKSNYLANFSTMPVLTLGSGATVTTNLALTNATSSISGNLVDANNSSIGLPAILLSAQAANGLMDVSFTDTNGNFTVGVASGQWGLRADDTSLIVHGYLGLQNRTYANAGQTGVALAVPQATALFYGSVKDTLGNPLTGIDVYASDNNDGLYETDGYTDANGNYWAAVLGGLGSDDPWQVDLSSNSRLANYLVSPPGFDSNGGTNMGAGQAALANFTALLATNYVSGSVKDNNGSPIAGVGVWAGTTINGLNYNAQTVDTDTNGNYSVMVGNGTWTIGINFGQCGDCLPGEYLCPPTQSVVISNNNGTANFTALLATNEITGSVTDSSGHPIGGVRLFANGTVGGVSYQSRQDTEGNGSCSLNVANGTWSVGLYCSGSDSDTLDNILGPGNYICPASQNVTITNNNGTASFIVQLCGVTITTTSLPAGQINVYYDQFLQGSSCSGTLSWSLLSGSPPPGLTWNPSSAEINGTPTTAGTYDFTVQVTDGLGHWTNQNFSLYIASSPSPLQVTTASLPNATQGVFYNQQLQASGGQPPYAWSLTPGSGSLPTGLSLATNGVISGAPALHGTFYFYVRVADAASATADRVLSLALQPAATITNGVTLSTWYQFTGGNDGGSPKAGLVQGNDGAFYGTAYSGGTMGDGTVFRIATNGVPIASVSFDYANGGGPEDGLVEGRDGSFYGTTSYGGANGWGALFNATTNGALTALHSFSFGDGGNNPCAGLVQGGDGNLYGTTPYWGTIYFTTNYNGTVFRISTNGAFQSLYSFTGGNDGANPTAQLAQGNDGSLYGTTHDGGSNGSGTVFKISTNGAFQSLYSFTGGNDGGHPLAGLALGSNGIFYGTTTGGGAGGCGTVFGITTNGAFNALYSFTGGNDGNSPYAGLAQGSDGNLYGTTLYGGAVGSGTVFGMTTNGVLATLYSFSGSGDGSQPLGSLLQGSDGCFYGTTSRGGAQDDGTVFRLSLTSAPSPDLAPLSVAAPASVITPQPNAAVQVAWSVTNQGAGQAPGGWCDRVWFSTNGVLDGNSAALGDFFNSQTLPPGGSYRQTNTVTLPLPAIAGGSYTLFVQADVYGQIYEFNKSNNISAGAHGLFTLAPPDLAVLAVNPATNNVVFYPASPQSPTVQLTWAVTNQGAGPAAGNWYDRVCVSTSVSIADGVSSQYFWQDWTSPPFAVGEEYQVTNTIWLPQQSGTYYLIVSVDDGNYIYEADKTNNVLASAPLTVNYQVRPPDLAVVSASAPATVASTQPYPGVQVTWSVTNQGTGVASGGWYDRVWFSTNGVLDGNSRDIGDFYQSQNLAAGGNYQQTNAVILPVTNSLSYTLFVQVDVYDQVYEPNKLNNLSAGVPEAFTLTPLWTIFATNNPPADGYISGTGSYLTGATNVLTAHPNFGYLFVNWTEGANVAGTNLSLTNVVFTNHVFAANYADATPTHVVTTATSPAGLAAVAGAGTYSNGQTAHFSAPLAITNPPSLYTFEQYTEGNNPVSSAAAFSKTFSTFDPASGQYVAVYSASPLLPIVVNVSLNLANPVPATTNFIVTVQFDRSMRTNPSPIIVLTNSAATLQPAVSGNGSWSATALSNDTYSTPPVTFISGMDGTNQIIVSGAQDLAGNVMALTNAGSAIVDATPPPVPVLAVTASNSSSVTVAWAAYAAPPDLSYFRVFFQPTNFTSVAGLPILTSLGSGARSFQFGGLALDTRYYAAVQAVDYAGNASGLSVLPVILPETVPPPVSVQAAPVGADSVLLSWNSYNTAALLGFAGFTLYEAPGNFTSVPGSLVGVPLGPSVQSYQVSGLDRAKTYYFAVVGFNLTNGFNPNVTTAVWSDPYAGNIGIDTTIGGAGQSQVPVYHSIVVVSNATLTLEPGTTLLFAPGASLTVQQGSLAANGTALAPIILDSANDTPGHIPAPGDWGGVILGSGAGSSSLNFVEVLYGGGLTVSGCSPAVSAFTANNNIPCGLALQNGAALTTSDALLTANGIGIQQSDTSALTIQNSVIQNNGTNAVASGSSPLNAASDWWGTAQAGTLAAQLQGNIVYTPFLTYEPVLTPAIGTSNGLTQVGSGLVNLQLACRTAEGMRLSEDYTFTGVFFTPFTNNTTFPLSAGGGLKRVYAQFRSVTGQTNAPLEVDVNYITAGPVIQSFSLAQGQTLNRPLTVTGSATAVLGMQDMEFYVDGVLAGTNAGGNLSQFFDIRALPNAIHEVKLLARDQSGNIATLQNTVIIALTPPPAPVITSPAAGLIVKTNLLSVSGSAEAGMNIQLTRNGQIVGATVADGTGLFTVSNATLVEGLNTLVAVAFDSTGTTPSAARNVIVETIPPAALVMNTPVYAPGTGLNVSWNFPPTGKLAVTFQLFWSQAPFGETNEATGHSIVLTGMADTLQGLSDGLYYFGVVGYDVTGAASPLSALVSTVYDATPPALTVSYSRAPPLGVGPVAISLTSSEALAGTPSLTLQPCGSVSPVLLSLTNVAVNTWQTAFTVTSSTPSGPVAVTASAQDLAGNVFNGVPNGPALAIDTVAPAASITTVPPPPVQTTNNVNVAVSLALTKPAGPGTMPTLSFTTPTGTNIVLTLSGGGSNWSGTLPLTPAAGAGFGQFSFSAQDAVGNVGSNLLAGGQLELYNTALPSAPAAPSGLSATSLAGGYVWLAWNAVSNAQIYRVYREPGTNLVPPAVLDLDHITSNGVADLPPSDGSYRYGVTASRLGSESGISNVVVAVSVRTPPLAPTNVTANLAASGVQISWQEPAGGTTPDHYNVYRNGTLIQTVSSVSPVVDYPPLGTNSYVVAAVDAVGNQNPSAPAVLFLPVAPVSNLAALSIAGQAPVLTWNTGGGSVGCNVYRNGIRQNAALITGTNYTDNLPLSDVVRYAVTAVNGSAQESPPRMVTVYPVRLSLLVNSLGRGADNPLLTGYFDQFQVGVSNLGSSNSLPLQQVQLLRTITGLEPLVVTLGAPTNVSAGTQLQELITVPESSVVAAQSVQVTVFQQTDSAGSTVVYENTFNLTDSRLPGTEIALSVNQLPLVGGVTPFQLQIFNRGYADMEVIVSRAFGAQPGDVFVSVQNSFGQEVSRTALSGLVSGATYLMDGTAYVTIPPGASHILTITNVLVPAALGGATNVTFLGVASEIYNQLETTNQQVSGPLSGSMVSPSLAQTPYYGTAQTDKADYSNNDPILISGQALDRTSGLPVPNVPLNIGFAARGFHWYQSVTTDSDGNYQLTYNPLAGFAGTLTIWAANPLVVDVLNEAQVVIFRMYAVPSAADVQMSKNGQLSFSIQLLNPGDVPLTGFTSSVQAWQLSGTNQIPIGTVTGTNQIPPGFVLGPGQTETVNLQLSAAINAPDNAQAQFTITSAEGATATLTASLDLFPAVPVLSVVNPAAGYLEVSLNRGDQLSGQITIANSGLMALQGITLAPPTNSWMAVNLPVASDGRIHLPDLGIGQSNTFAVVFTPPTNTVLGFYQDAITVQGTNAASPFPVNVYAQVTSSQTGGIQFEVDDILGEQVPNAAIRLHNNALLSDWGPFYTDTNGLVTVTNLQEGDWNWQVTAAGCSGNVGTVTVIADQIVYQPTRLSRSLVTVNFTVVPVPFTDSYQIQVEQTYETYVPVGVLVLDPPYLGFTNLPSGFQATFTTSAENQGLAQMTDVTLTGSEANGFSVTPLITYIPVLLPMQSVEVPMVVALDSPGVAGGQNAQARQSTSDCVSAQNIQDFLTGVMVLAQALQMCPKDSAPETSLANEILEDEIEEATIGESLEGSVAGATVAAELAGALIGCAHPGISSFFLGTGGYSGPSYNTPVAAPGFNLPNGCFSASTSVLMGDGTEKPISEIRIGDTVRSGPKPGNIAVVYAVYSLTATNFQEIRFVSADAKNARSLTATDEHRFWVDGKGWVAAGVVAAGDWLFDSSGRRLSVVASQSVTRSMPAYTFSLADDNAFYANGVLVHDLCGAPPAGSRVRTSEVAK